MTGPVLQREITADAFYAERDARAGLEHPLATLPARRIAIVVPENLVSTSVGTEVAFFWTASIIRRMGRPFAELILVTPNEFRQSESRLACTNRTTIEQLVTEELKSADPFTRVEWRAWTDGMNLADAEWIIWLGKLPLGIQHPRTLAINAHGWIADLCQPPETELSLTSADFDAAPAAIVFAACMAAERVFSEAFVQRDFPRQMAFALDRGTGTSDPATRKAWLESDTTNSAMLPWKESVGVRPTSSKLLVVSAGGIGSNFCRILRDSYFRAESAYVLDPDGFEISNLNRAIGVGLQSVGMPKATIAADFLRLCVDNVSPLQTSYESWMNATRSEEFRQPGTVVVIGVDQVRSRLAVGSDWPWIILNGATSGGTYSTGIHVKQGGGCIGCWYGQDEATYMATRTPMACVAGVAPGALEFRQVASYPFVSVAAAASIVASLVRVSYQSNAWEEYAGTISSVSLRSPDCAQTRRLAVSDRCLLLCSADYVQAALRRDVERREL